MLLNEFLTEYDDSLGSELNIDPLGLQVIWSAFGQQIFQNRISSISNDVRNYTLNLFNHWLIKNLIDDESVALGNGLKKVYAGKNDLNFKHACLVYLENLYVYSVIAHQDTAGLESTGVLGISKARRRWYERGENPRLLFSHGSEAQVLVRQTMLGVSGRYKTPLVEMGFFDRQYHYSLPTAAPLWKSAGTLINSVPTLSHLYDELRLHLRELLASNSGEPKWDFCDIPTTLTQALTEAFPSSAVVGANTRGFWLSVTELDQGAPGALYKVLSPAKSGEGLSSASAADVFAMAVRQPLSREEQDKLEHVRLLEPLLGELDLLFNLMLAEKSQSLKEVQQRWQVFGRNAVTLTSYAAPFEENVAMSSVLSATGQSRLNRLLVLTRRDNVQAQMCALLDYHAEVMESRGQSPWLSLINGAQLKLQVRPRGEPAIADRPLGGWVHQYYIPQFRHLLGGLQGVTA